MCVLSSWKQVDGGRVRCGVTGSVSAHRAWMAPRGGPHPLARSNPSSKRQRTGAVQDLAGLVCGPWGCASGWVIWNDERASSTQAGELSWIREIAMASCVCRGGRELGVGLASLPDARIPSDRFRGYRDARPPATGWEPSGFGEHPGGMAAMSRGLRAATPPETMKGEVLHPGRGASGHRFHRSSVSDLALPGSAAIGRMIRGNRWQTSGLQEGGYRPRRRSGRPPSLSLRWSLPRA